MELNKQINGKTKIYGVIGNPVEHSLSPIIQNSLSRLLCINSQYLAFNINNNLDAIVLGIKSIGISGINITYPYKDKITKYGDVLSDDCKILSTCNTIKIKNKEIYCYSTDGKGFVDGFKCEFATDFKDKKVLLLGFGGAGRAIALAILKDGTEKLYINNRAIDKIENFKSKIDNKMASKIEIVDSIEDIEVDVIINSTSIGFNNIEDVHPLISNYVFKKEQYVVDIVYNPLETKLLKKARSFETKTQNGISMLVFQAIESFSIWNDVKISGDIGKEICTLMYEELKKCN